MTSNVKPIPDGASVVIPILVCRDAGPGITTGAAFPTQTI
jgi:hypothetical protein